MHTPGPEVEASTGSPAGPGAGRDPEPRQAASDDIDPLRLLCLATNDAVAYWNAESGRVWRSKGLADLLGETGPIPPTREWLLERIHPEDRPRIEAEAEKAIAAGGPFLFEYRLRRADGSFFAVEDRGVVLRGPGGAPLRSLGVFRDATESKRLQESWDTAAKLKLLFEQSPLGISIADPDYTLLEVNRTLCEMTGYSRVELEGRWALSITHPEDLAKEQSAAVALLSGESDTLCLEKRNYRSDGSPLWVEVTVRLIRDPDGRPRFFVRQLIDITAKKRAEEQLERLTKFSRDLIIYGELGLALDRVSPSVWQLLGYTAEELHGQSWLELVHPADRLNSYRQFERILAGEPTVSFENRLVHRDGSIRWFSWNAAPPTPGFTQIFSVGRDITAAKRDQEQARLLANLTQRISNPVILTDALGKTIWVNESFTGILGYSIGEAAGRDSAELLQGAGTGANAVASLLSRVAAGEGARLEIQIFTKAGEERWLDVDAQPLVSGSGEMTHFLLVASDITERRRQEIESRQHEQLLVQAWRIAKLGAWQYLPVAGEFSWSVGVREIWGLPEDYRPDWHQVLDWLHPGDRERLRSARALAVEKGIAWDLELRVTTPGGTSKWIRSAGDPEMQNGVCRRVSGIVQDITDRKQLEEQWIQAQRFDALGRLAGGVGHDFNNLLMVIGGCAGVLQESEDLPASVRPVVEEISRGVARAANLTSQLLSVSRAPALKLARHDIHALLREMESLLLRLIDGKVRLRLEYGAAPLFARVDAVKFEQIVMNLVVNARDAMPNGGDLVISTSSESIESPSASRSLLAAGQYAAITVSDSGVGMDDATQRHIFEPFFSTKKSGKGAGLGLAIVYNAARQMYGRVEVESSPGAGSRFRVFLPGA